MVIDFRVRPPYKHFLDMGLYAGGFDPDYPSLAYGADPPRSVLKGDIGAFIAELDEAGIDHAVVCGRDSKDLFFGKGNVPPDEVYELVNCYKGRLIGVAGIDALDPKAPKIIERSIRDLGLSGISLEPAWCAEPCYCDDPRFEPIYQKAAELNVFVMITLSFLLGPDLSYSDPVHLEHVVSKYSDINFLVPHASWPHFIGMMAVTMKHKNLHMIPDFYMYLPFMPMRADFMPMFNTVLKRQVVYASSYPVRSLSQALTMWKNQDWDPEALQFTLHQNAARILKLNK